MMSARILVLCLLSSVISTAASLKCHTCFACGDECKNEDMQLVECGEDEKYCLTYSYRSTMISPPLSFTAKSCAKAEQCSNAYYYGVTSVAGKYLQARVACCENDGCNAAPLPLPGRDILKPNGFVCPGSLKQNGVSEESGPVLCLGDEDQCFSSKCSMRALASLKCQTCFASGDKCRNEDMQLVECGMDEKYCLTFSFRSTMTPSPLSFTAKSCATVEQCSNAYYGVTSVARKYLQARIACCENDGCNTEPLPKFFKLNLQGRHTSGTINASLCLRYTQSIHAVIIMSARILVLCLLSSLISTAPSPLSFTAKSCAKAEQCSNAYHSVTSLAGKYQQKRIACCENDGCNTAPLPMSAYFSTVDAQGCTTKNSCSYPLGKVEEANGLILYDIETLECQNPEGLEGWRDFSKTFGWS
ncbi:hypothetical protein Chor_005276 [Crotalus horridus]